MVNHKPHAADQYVSGYDPANPVIGNILDGSDYQDADGDLVRLNFVNGQRINRLSDSTPASTVIVGQYGTLSIDQNGFFSYLLDPTDPDVIGLDPGEVLIEQFTFKISDGRGATDFGLLDIAVDVPEIGTFSANFEDAGRDFPEGYKGFEWGALMDGDELPLVTEANGNHYVQSGAYTTLIRTVDGRDLRFEDFAIASSDGSLSEVTFAGYRDGDLVATETATVTGEDLSTAQHISLTGMGPIDELRVSYTVPGYDGDYTDYPKLKFDDFLFVA